MLMPPPSLCRHAIVSLSLIFAASMLFIYYAVVDADTNLAPASIRCFAYAAISLRYYADAAFVTPC